MTATDAIVVGLSDMRAAHERIRPHVMRTPVVPMTESRVALKAESLQPSGSFKVRGAFNTLLQLSAHERDRGVVAHSSGNHAIAVAHAGAALGIRVVVVMPADAPVVKVARTRSLGADVVLVGSASSERAARAAELVVSHGYRLVEPYDSNSVIAATGTVTIEIVEDLVTEGGSVAELYVPISGGGLAAGVAAAAKQLDPNIRVIGVEPAVAADALASRQAGHIVELPAEQMAGTAADGLRVQKVGTVTWPYLERYLDEIVTVTEDEISAAVRAVADAARLVAEPSGATPVAAALAGRGGTGAPAQHRVAVLSGGNVDPTVYLGILDRAAPRP